MKTLPFMILVVAASAVVSCNRNNDTGDTSRNPQGGAASPAGMGTTGTIDTGTTGSATTGTGTTGSGTTGGGNP